MGLNHTESNGASGPKEIPALATAKAAKGLGQQPALEPMALCKKTARPIDKENAKIYIYIYIYTYI